MIHLPRQSLGLTAEEDFGLSLLVDLARLIPVSDPQAPVVHLQVSGSSVPGNDPLALSGPIEVKDRAVVIPRPVLSAAARLAAATAEQATSATDHLGRVPTSENPLVTAGVWGQPVVSAAAVRFRAAVVRAAADRPVWLVAPWPEGRRWAASFTHDLDLVSGWPAATALRSVELIRHHAPAQALSVLRSAVGALARNPVTTGVTRLLARLSRHGVRGTWFVIAGRPSLRSWLRGDVTYRVEASRARDILTRVAAQGHEIGLHGSFITTMDASRMRAERERLQSVTGAEVRGVRQHFLRARPGATHRAMIQTGFTYDATAGFPDRNGFRLGLADPAPWWDAGAGEPTDLEQVPLTWMDRALSKYGGVENPEAWVAEGADLARRCQSVEGLWVGLWHPNLTAPLGFPGAEEALDDLLATVLDERPHVAPLASLVAWRRRRRAVRAASVAEDGRPVLTGEPVPLELAPAGLAA